MKTSSDTELVRKTLNGDKASFGLLYDKYARLIRAICFDVTRDVSHAEDLCQDVFVEAFSKLTTLRQPEQFSAWLTGIAKFKCRNWLKKNIRQRNLKANIELAELPGESDTQNHDEIRQLHAKLLELPDKERLALQLHYLCEEPSEVSMTVLGLSQSGLYAVLDRAKRKLRKLMGSNSQETTDE